jgi:hypothetical protein
MGGGRQKRVVERTKEREKREIEKWRKFLENPVNKSPSWYEKFNKWAIGFFICLLFGIAPVQ